MFSSVKLKATWEQILYFLNLCTPMAKRRAAAAAAAAKSLQSCLTLCEPIDGSPPGSPVPGILQARTLERVAISFSSAWKWSHSVISNSLQPHGLQPTRLLCPRDPPGNNTGVGCQCPLRKELVLIKRSTELSPSSQLHNMALHK